MSKMSRNGYWDYREVALAGVKASLVKCEDCGGTEERVKYHKKVIDI